MTPLTSCVVQQIRAEDRRFELPDGAGSDSIHSNPQYSFAVTRIETSSSQGSGLVLTLGDGNDLVCNAIERFSSFLAGREIEEIMSQFGTISRLMSNHHQLRWLGPHKGVVHLALASITNACFDLWAKARNVPLWKLLIDLEPEQIVSLLDLSYVEDCLTEQEALQLLREMSQSKGDRQNVIVKGYPGYDTSVGWFNYTDEQLSRNAEQALSDGFQALKLKVGADNPDRDISRAYRLREIAGSDIPIMLDANQAWSVPEAISICRQFGDMNPFWIEEPTHPDDVLGHRAIAEAIAPIPVAMGEHVPNRIVFKNAMEAGGAKYIQVDCTRVAGVSEFITVSLLARKFGLKVVPHVGDMGQIHQHLVLFNHIALGHEIAFLEYIPHLRSYFVHPARVENGRYITPSVPGSSSDLKDQENQT